MERSTLRRSRRIQQHLERPQRQQPEKTKRLSQAAECRNPRSSSAKLGFSLRSSGFDAACEAQHQLSQTLEYAASWLPDTLVKSPSLLSDACMHLKNINVRCLCNTLPPDERYYLWACVFICYTSLFIVIFNVHPDEAIEKRRPETPADLKTQLHPVSVDQIEGAPFDLESYRDDLRDNAKLEQDLTRAHFPNNRARQVMLTDLLLGNTDGWRDIADTQERRKKAITAAASAAFSASGSVEPNREEDLSHLYDEKPNGTLSGKKEHRVQYVRYDGDRTVTVCAEQSDRDALDSVGYTWLGTSCAHPAAPQHSTKDMRNTATASPPKASISGGGTVNTAAFVNHQTAPAAASVPATPVGGQLTVDARRPNATHLTGDSHRGGHESTNEGNGKGSPGEDSRPKSDEDPGKHESTNEGIGKGPPLPRKGEGHADATRRTEGSKSRIEDSKPKSDENPGKLSPKGKGPPLPPRKGEGHADATRRTEGSKSRIEDSKPKSDENPGKLSPKGKGPPLPPRKGEEKNENNREARITADGQAKSAGEWGAEACSNHMENFDMKLSCKRPESVSGDVWVTRCASTLAKAIANAMVGFETFDAREALELAFKYLEAQPEEEANGKIGGGRNRLGWADVVRRSLQHKAWVNSIVATQEGFSYRRAINIANILKECPDQPSLASGSLCGIRKNTFAIFIDELSLIAGVRVPKGSTLSEAQQSWVHDEQHLSEKFFETVSLAFKNRLAENVAHDDNMNCDEQWHNASQLAQSLQYVPYDADPILGQLYRILRQSTMKNGPSKCSNWVREMNQKRDRLFRSALARAEAERVRLSGVPHAFCVENLEKILTERISWILYGAVIKHVATSPKVTPKAKTGAQGKAKTGAQGKAESASIAAEPLGGAELEKDKAREQRDYEVWRRLSSYTNDAGEANPPIWYMSYGGDQREFVTLPDGRMVQFPLGGRKTPSEGLTSVDLRRPLQSRRIDVAIDSKPPRNDDKFPEYFEKIFEEVNKKSKKGSDIHQDVQVYSDVKIQLEGFAKYLALLRSELTGPRNQLLSDSAKKILQLAPQLPQAGTEIDMTNKAPWTRLSADAIVERTFQLTQTEFATRVKSHREVSAATRIQALRRGFTTRTEVRKNMRGFLPQEVPKGVPKEKSERYITQIIGNRMGFLQKLWSKGSKKG